VAIARPVETPSNNCRDAVKRVWPAELQTPALITLHAENGLETADRIGGLNFDGSIDYGCMMINNKAHANWFATHDWSNAVENVTEAYRIYQGRGNFSAWYAVCTPNRIPKFGGISCK
jgi:hypothetical protein